MIFTAIEISSSINIIIVKYEPIVTTQYGDHISNAAMGRGMKTERQQKTTRCLCYVYIRNSKPNINALTNRDDDVKVQVEIITTRCVVCNKDASCPGAVVSGTGIERVEPPTEREAEVFPIYRRRHL